MRKQIIMKLPSRYEYKGNKVSVSTTSKGILKNGGDLAGENSDDEEAHKELVGKIASLHKRL